MKFSIDVSVKISMKFHEFPDNTRGDIDCIRLHEISARDFGAHEARNISGNMQ